MRFEDGASPPPEIILQWNELVENTFHESKADQPPCIAVHCVAGLGR